MGPVNSEVLPGVDRTKIKAAVRMLLEAVGEDPDREGLQDTPRRVADMYEELFAGLYEDPALHLEVTFADEHERTW